MAWMDRRQRNAAALGIALRGGSAGLTATAAAARARQRCTRCLDSLDAGDTGIEDKTHPGLCPACERDWHGLNAQPMD